MTSPIITITSSIPMPFMLDAGGRALIESVTRLLLRLQQPSLMARALIEGYSTEEHQLAWELIVNAGGGTTTVELNVASGALESADATVAQRRLAYLQQLALLLRLLGRITGRLFAGVAGTGSALHGGGRFSRSRGRVLGQRRAGGRTSCHCNTLVQTGCQWHG